MFLNASIPHIYCLLRKEFLYDQQRGHGEYEPCAVFGVTSIQSRAVMFTVMTERGAQVDRLPVSAFCWKPCDPLPLGHLEAWDAFSYDIAVTEYEYLRGLSCFYLSRARRWYRASYVLTLDWAKSAYAEDAGEGGHKSGHLLRLDAGHFAIAPNNRIFWREGSFVTKPFAPGDRPDYLTNSHNWSAEDGHKWVTEDGPAMFYEERRLDEEADAGGGPGPADVRVREAAEDPDRRRQVSALGARGRVQLGVRRGGVPPLRRRKPAVHRGQVRQPGRRGDRARRKV